MAPGKIKVSLRSVAEWDTTRVTEALGGGGHRAASACIVADADFEGWRLRGS
jgi:nanoRNase/pAp phosphatase (c-di-AMP/oligoRNAs hydrolase)